MRVTMPSDTSGRTSRGSNNSTISSPMSVEDSQHPLSKSPALVDALGSPKDVPTSDSVTLPTVDVESNTRGHCSNTDCEMEAAKTQQDQGRSM